MVKLKLIQLSFVVIFLFSMPVFSSEKPSENKCVKSVRFQDDNGKIKDVQMTRSDDSDDLNQGIFCPCVNPCCLILCALGLCYCNPL